MKQIIIILTCTLSFGLLSCVQSERLTEPSLTAVGIDEPIITPTQVVEATPTTNPNVTPTFTPKEQAALAKALDALGNKADNLVVRRVGRTGQGTADKIQLQQTYHGIPVMYAYTIVLIEPNQSPEIRGTYYDNVSLPSITPTITLDEAKTIARDMLNIVGDYKVDHYYKSYLIVNSIPTKGKYREFILSWRIFITADCPFGTWGVTINAYTGDILDSFKPFGLGEPTRSSACPTPLPIRRPTPVEGTWP